MHQPEGVCVLPRISGTTKPEEIKAVLRQINKKMGKAGKKAVATYLESSGIPKESETFMLIDSIFGKGGESSAGAARRKGPE